MSTRDEEFLRALRSTFRVEAAEHLQTITAGLLDLEKATDPDARRPFIESVFRAVHSLKGASRAVNFADIESLCQSLEDTFARWKRGEDTPTPETLDIAHRALDAITTAVSSTPGLPPRARPAPRAEAPARMAPQVTPATSAPSRATAAAEAPSPHAAPPASSTETETVRVPVSALDARLLQAEELLTAKLLSAQRVSDIDALQSQLERWEKEWTKAQPYARALHRVVAREGAAGAPELASVLEFLEWNQSSVRSLESAIQALRRASSQDRFVIDHLVDDLMESAKKLVMLPVSTLGTLLPKTVRDLSRDQGKEADFVIQGESVRVDKRVLDDMKDPLLHLLRNCVDHGVELPEARRSTGKPARARIALSVSSIGGNQIEMLVSDDGSGVDVARLKSLAVRRGLLSAEAAERLPDEEALALVFEPDLSTSPIVTKVSGRGLGLAIVRETAARLGGHVSIASRRGIGTDIRITLPLALSTFRGVLVDAEERRFVVPTAQVERVIRFRAEDIATVEGRETLTFDGRAIALVRLADVLRLPPGGRRRDADRSSPALVLGSGEHRVAFAVDEIIDEREVLVKPLRKPLMRVRNIAGATVLGSGAVAPVLHVADLLRSARSVEPGPRDVVAEAPEAGTAKRVLVAEDSITSRLLIKGILEAAGYYVRTAVDGVDAYTALREESFDLVVSDVEMPRMNGFDLTARIRSDRALESLPVVLVTALESREDRERGIDVGASAYLVKSSLDQSNLLETLRRLV